MVPLKMKTFTSLCSTKNGRHETLTAEMETREVAKMEKTEKYKNV
jgi:hypothetical protein